MDKKPSFTVTLVSNQSLDEFPYNTSSVFSNLLARPLKFENEQYEVGLQQIFYRDPTAAESHNAVKTCIIKKETNTFQDFLLECIQPLKTIGVSVITKIENRKEYVVFKFDTTDGYDLEMSLLAAEIFGFKSQRLTAGTNTAENPFQEDRFKGLPMQTLFQFSKVPSALKNIASETAVPSSSTSTTISSAASTTTTKEKTIKGSYKVKKTTQDIWSFIIEVRNTIKPQGIDITHYISNRTEYMVIYYDDKTNPGSILELSENVQRVFGFTKPELSPGRHVGESPLDIKKFTDLSLNASFDFTVVQYIEKPSLAPKSGVSQKSTFFDFAKGEENFTLEKKDELTYAVLANKKRYTDWILDNKTFLERIGVTFRTKVTDRKEYSIIKFVDISRGGYSLLITPEFSKILGFRQIIFKPGEYTSTEPINDDALKSLIDGTKILFTLTRYAPVSLKLEQLPADASAEVLLDAVDEAISGAQIWRVFILAQMSDATFPPFIYGKIDNPDIRSVKFSARFNQFFNLPADFVFFNKTSAIVPAGIFEAERNRIKALMPNKPVLTNDEIEKIKLQRRHNILVTCNLIEDQLYGTGSESILRILNRSENVLGGIAHVTFQPIVYFQVIKENVSSIQISLKDEFGEALPAFNAPTTIVLHFRPTSQ